MSAESRTSTDIVEELANILGDSIAEREAIKTLLWEFYHKAVAAGARAGARQVWEAEGYY